MDLEYLLSMDPATILLVPVVVVVTAVVIFLHSLVLKFLSTATVRNKVVVITDALTGLGNECAKLFHEGGARVILCGKTWEKLEGFADNLTSAADPKLTFPPKLVLVDFGDMNSIPAVIAETLECYGCVDVLILNSSLKVKAPVQSTSLKMDKLVMDNNYFGPITVAKGFLPSMMLRRTGHVILVNSIQGKLAMPFRATYAASKHAVQAFFDCLRAEVQEYGISVSTVNHTFIISPPPGEKTKKSIWSRHQDGAVLRYKFTSKNEVDLLSTYVPESFRGKGVATLLSKAAMDFLVEENLKAHISCWYIKKYVEENPLLGYKDLIIS